MARLRFCPFLNSSQQSAVSSQSGIGVQPYKIQRQFGLTKTTAYCPVGFLYRFAPGAVTRFNSLKKELYNGTLKFF